MPERRLFEAVPNFSEGRRPEVIEALVSAAAGVHVLDADPDPDHNRVVLSLASGDPGRLGEALVEAVAVAVERIDLPRHRGVHPRIGAADVLPIVPLGSTGMDECVELARATGERIWRSLKVPVYFYGSAAGGPERAGLAAIRSGRLRPDLGGDPHPTAGACCVGARPALVAYNVLLEGVGAAQGKDLARALRASSGGLRGVQALAFALPGGRVQLSMNLVDLQAATPASVRAEIGRLVRALGIGVRGPLHEQVVGLCPASVAVPAASGRLLEGRLAGAAARRGAGAARARRDVEHGLLAGRLEAEAEALGALGADPGDRLAGAERAAALTRVLDAAGCLVGDLETTLSVAAAGLRVSIGADLERRFPERVAALDRRLRA